MFKFVVIFASSILTNSVGSTFLKGLNNRRLYSKASSKLSSVFLYFLEIFPLHILYGEFKILSNREGEGAVRVQINCVVYLII
jgi:hypothetical protein